MVGLLPEALPDDFTIPAKPEGFKGRQDLGGAAGNFPGRIEIFDAQQPTPPRTPGQAITAHRRNQRTEVQRTGRAGGKTADDGGIRH